MAGARIPPTMDEAVKSIEKPTESRSSPVHPCTARFMFELYRESGYLVEYTAVYRATVLEYTQI